MDFCRCLEEAAIQSLVSCIKEVMFHPLLILQWHMGV